MKSHLLTNHGSEIALATKPQKRWPLGINPSMDAHAAELGLSHWSCGSAESNEQWQRVDGLVCWPFNTFGHNTDYPDALRCVDAANPIPAAG